MKTPSKKKVVVFLLLLVLAFLCFTPVFADGYRIADVRYDITGGTKAYALNLAVPIDRDRIFPTLEDLDTYINQVQTQFMNLRVLKECSVTYVVADEEAEGNVALVALTVTTMDSHNWIIAPYPKYSSSAEDTPVEIKLKFKHYNFLGLMQTLDFDINWNTNFKENNTVGFNLGYDFPFKAGPLDAQWLNDWELAYNSILEPEDEDEEPYTGLEFNFTTGLKFVLPLKNVDMEFTAKHSFNMDHGEDGLDDPNNYKENGDSFYMTDSFKIAAPLTLHVLDNLSRFYFTPYMSFTYNWDHDGIVSPDLLKTSFNFGGSVSNRNIDWKGNFRKGYSLSFGADMAFNFANPYPTEENSELIVPSVDADVRLFTSGWNRVGIISRLHAFTNFRSSSYGTTSTRGIGGSLRGIRDDQDGVQKGFEYTDNVLRTPSAIIVNLDLPVRLFTTDWRGWGKTLFKKDMPRWFHALDFELQVSPFVDMALTENLVAGSSFDIKDGWYSAGLEVLAFPDRWRSLVVRASLGIDMGYKIFDRPWQEEPGYPLSSILGHIFNEITIGIGLFF